MRKKVAIALVFGLMIGIVGYRYIYKDHRNISDEAASYSSSVSEIYQSYLQNDSLANSKFLDKTIEIKGKITGVDIQNKLIMVDEKLSARYTKGKHGNFKEGDSITLKGRLVGYDDLLDEIQMDQCTIQKITKK